jgi:hypothetical protein
MSPDKYPGNIDVEPDRADGSGMDAAARFTAFDGVRLVAAGDLASVAQAAAAHGAPVLILDDASGRPVELDLRQGPEPAVAAYLARLDGLPPTPGRGVRGRPRLGVVSREVTLLPRHWEWLSAQPGGASAALRRLVEDARRAAAGTDRHRLTRDALYRVMSTLAGDLPGFEEASRALFAANDPGFDAIIAAWPKDIAAYVSRLAAAERALRSGV